MIFTDDCDVQIKPVRYDGAAYIRDRQWCHETRVSYDGRTPEERERDIQRYERLAAMGMPLFGGEWW